MVGGTERGRQGEASSASDLDEDTEGHICVLKRDIV